MYNKNKKRTPAQLFEELERIANVIPTPLYWLDKRGVLIGANDVVCNQLGGPEIRDKITGKFHEEYYPDYVAKKLNENTKKVLESGQTIEFEEEVVNLSTGDTQYYIAIRSPLRDDDENIIGTIGTSVDITTKKEVERLQKETERLRQEAAQLKLQNQEQLLQEKEKFIALAHKVAHDISSPLTALSMMIPTCTELEEGKRTIIKRATESILDIANNLLSTYRNEEQRATSNREPSQSLLVSDLIVQLLSEKKAQYSNLAVEFETIITDEAWFAFAHMQASQFRRCMSNIINNAVDALDNKSNGLVVIKLLADAQSIIITIGLYLISNMINMK